MIMQVADFTREKDIGTKRIIEMGQESVKLVAPLAGSSGFG